MNLGSPTPSEFYVIATYSVFCRNLGANMTLGLGQVKALYPTLGHSYIITFNANSCLCMVGDDGYKELTHERPAVSSHEPVDPIEASQLWVLPISLILAFICCAKGFKISGPAFSSTSFSLLDLIELRCGRGDLKTEMEQVRKEKHRQGKTEHKYIPGQNYVDI